MTVGRKLCYLCISQLMELKVTSISDWISETHDFPLSLFLCKKTAEPGPVWQLLCSVWDQFSLLQWSGWERVLGIDMQMNVSTISLGYRIFFFILCCHNKQLRGVCPNHSWLFIFWLLDERDPLGRLFSERRSPLSVSLKLWSEYFLVG